MSRRKSYGTMMEKCGHEVKYLEIRNKSKENAVKDKVIKLYNPDVVWFLSPFYVKSNEYFIEYVKSRNIPIVVYCTFNPQEAYNREDWIKVWKSIDVFFVQHKEFNNFLRKENVNSHYIPLGFYPKQYYETCNKKIYDISFCGTSLIRESKDKDKRATYLRNLKKYNTVVFGKSFRGKVGQIPVFSYKKHSEQRMIYSRTKINIDLPFYCTPDKFYLDEKRVYHFKNRFFEVPATRNFLLTVRCPDFLEIFDEDMVGYYDDNIESLKEEVSRYLKDKDKRKKMATRAYKEVHQKHTFLHRFKKMFEIIKEEYLK